MPRLRAGVRASLILPRKGEVAAKLTDGEESRSPPIESSPSDARAARHQHRVNRAPRGSGHAGGMTDPVLLAGRIEAIDR